MNQRRVRSIPLVRQPPSLLSKVGKKLTWNAYQDIYRLIALNQMENSTQEGSYCCVQFNFQENALLRDNLINHRKYSQLELYRKNAFIPLICSKQSLKCFCSHIIIRLVGGHTSYSSIISMNSYVYDKLFCLRFPFPMKLINMKVDANIQTKIMKNFK